MVDDEFTQRFNLFNQAWDLVEDTERDLKRRRRRAGWLKRVTVCWWKHRTRRVAAGTYLSTGCWACTGKVSWR